MPWLLFALLAAAPAEVSGIVHDQTGAVVPGATIVIRGASGVEVRGVSGPDGRFTIEWPEAGTITMAVRAGGFAEQIRTVTEAEEQTPLDIRLEPASLRETITVTASGTEEPTGQVAASVDVVTKDDIRQSPAVVADDVLRQVPTFSLFRRASSLSSHPTSQGVTLRGLGPSGVSRTLVVMDGVPQNDPFGGWVYWTRVPLQAVDRIEIVDGPAASLYGNFAMGGVINIFSAPPVDSTLEVRSQIGSLRSPKVDVFGAEVRRRVAATVSGSAFRTDGFPIVLASERGVVDNKAAVNFGTVAAKADYQPTGRVGLFARGSYFLENRDNGKASTFDGTEEANDTRWTSGSAGVRATLPDGSTLSARLFLDDETFHSNFLAVPAATPPRSIGRMTLNQRVPTTGAGVSVEWARTLGSRHQLQAGLGWRWVKGESQEDGLDAVKGLQVTLHRASGGEQRNVGVFAQDQIRPLADLTVTVGARIDAWRNYDAHNFEVNEPAGTPTANNRVLPERADTALSPRLAASYRLSDRINVWGGVSGGFRAPTLNELYRQFRVGALLTLPNDQLGPERLVGGEIGVNASPVKNLSTRVTWFDNRVKDPVSNVTITPNTLQQRENLGRTHVRGVQADAEYRFAAAWRVAGAYLYDRATVEEFRANPSLVGKVLPQVPKHRGSLQLVYSDERYATVAFELRFVGRQFDDDQNTRTVPGESSPGLPGYTLADLSIRRELRPGVEVFAGAQNVFNTQTIVGTLPTTIGAPRLINGGMRVRVF